MRSDVSLRHRRFTRAAFTLIEMMVVLLIISILVGLLLVGVSAVRKNVYISMTVMELDQIKQALTQYKTDHTEFPPSAGEWTTAVGGSVTTNWAERRTRLQNHFRKMFPRLTANFPPDVAVGTAVNIYATTYNPDGTLAAPTLCDLRKLDAAEAYLFFLNGPPILKILTTGGRAQPFGFAGWAKDPTNPIDDQADEEKRTQRSQTLFEIPASRLIDTDEDYWPEYRAYESTLPVVYFRGDQCTYRSGTTTTFPCAYSYGESGVAQPYSSRQIPDLNDGTLNTRDAWMNQNSFQLIVAGQDRNFGEGTLPVPASSNRVFPFTKGSVSISARSFEVDNLTNFYNTTIGSAE